MTSPQRKGEGNAARALDPLHNHHRIQPLPGPVVAQLTSSNQVTSLISVVIGLFENSIDANSTKVTITIEPSRGSCSVTDNGVGIHPYEFAPDGGLGKAHCMSPPRALS